jgi:hypothetical protein
MECNIWALEKDISIKCLLLLLTDTFGAETFDVIAPDEGHAQSIRLIRPDEQNMHAYIYTYGQKPECYGIHLEYPSSVDSLRFDTTEIIEELSYERLVAILAVHFNIASYKDSEPQKREK